jgi:hypothetical protein
MASSSTTTASSQPATADRGRRRRRAVQCGGAGRRDPAEADADAVEAFVLVGAAVAVLADDLSVSGSRISPTT